MTFASQTQVRTDTQKYQVVEVDSSIRPARVTILSTHSDHEDATKAWKASAFANIDYYDISHSIVEVNDR